jgi:UDPglucose--hexose-1-phosphate uridylyltransferase
METAPSAAPFRPSRLHRTAEGSAEFRHDPITDQWTIFAPHRDKRPDEFEHFRSAPVTAVDCPFCGGNEAETPPSVWIAGPSDEQEPVSSFAAKQQLPQSGWSVRVVPNKFPAVHPLDGLGHGADFCREAITGGYSAGGNSLFQSRPISGGHEVVIESPRHVHSLSQLDLSEVALVLAAYRDRIRYWRSVRGIRYISIFKNVGGDAGASLYHGHSQLVATNYLPSAVAGNAERAERYRAATGCCLHCDLIRAELKEKRRVIAQNDSMVAYCPYASRMPLLVRITTKAHHDRFEDLPAEATHDVARMIRRVVGWLERLRPGAPYNVLLHTRPPGIGGQSDAHHWSLEIFPRLTRIAGFELGSDCMINPVLPENAAERYRACASSEDPRRTLGPPSPRRRRVR